MPFSPSQSSALSRSTPRLESQRLKKKGYTLVEMLTTIAVLVIAMGLMVSLARRVRAQSAESVTKSLLRSLDTLMSQYYGRYHRLPTISPFVPPGYTEGRTPDEQALQHNAIRNNRELLHVLRGQADLTSRAFADLPISIYDEATLRDAWGTPIVFLPEFHPAIGIAPGNRCFFVSAGPDGHFLSRDDNLYSYEGPSPKEYENEP